MEPPASESTLIQQQKRALRQAMRLRRRELDDGVREQLNSALNKLVLERLIKLQPCRVSAYLPFDGEPDLTPALLHLQQLGFQLALPFIEKQGANSHMIFRLWLPKDALSQNQLGFSEPSGGQQVAVADISVILMPLVAWDINGARLGMGAGYYDRALAPLRNQNPPLRIGIAFDVQRSAEIPTDPHDVPLHELISNSQRFTFQA